MVASFYFFTKGVKTMEVFKILGTIAINNKDANDGIEETAGKAEKGSSRIVSAFKAIGTAVTTYFAADKIISFGKACVETAAAVNASNAQFQQTFTTGGEDLTKTAKNIIDTVAEDSGILATRLQDSATKIYAFAKSSGADSAEALSLMETALTAAADTAAYYDTSLEDATETLQSFLKGNFANDAALGVSCTETTRNAKAMELFGEKYNDLSEIQKQQTLLKMVTDSQELSGAMGQAAREADGWENVTGNLSEAWRQFMAVIGDPILEKITPIVKDITSKIQQMTAKVAPLGDKFASMGKKIKSVGGYLSSTFAPVIENVKAIFERVKNAIQPLIDKFFEYKNSGGLATDATNVLKAALEYVALSIETVTGWIIKAIDWIGEFWSENDELKSGILEIWASIQEFFAAAWEEIKLVWDAVQPYFEQIWAGIELAFSVAKDVLGEIFSAAFTYIKSVWDTVSGYFSTIWENIKAVFSGEIDPRTFFNNIFQAGWEAIKSIWDAAIGFFVDIWNGITAVFSTEEGQTLISGVFEAAWAAIKLYWDFVVGYFQAVWDGIAAIFSGVASWFNENVISPIGDFFSGLFDAIAQPFVSAYESVKNAWSSLASWFDENVISPIKSVLNFEWTWPNIPMPHFGISPAGWSIGDLLDGVIPSLGVEWYAKAMDKPLLMEQPTAFGIGSNGQILAGGEKGSEVVSGTDTLMNMISEAVARQNAGLENALGAALDGILNLLSEYIPQMASKQLMVDGNSVVGALSPMMDSSMGRTAIHKKRGN